MSKYDSSSGVNMLSNIGSNTRIPILFPKHYEVWAMHFEVYITRIEEHNPYMWESIMNGPHQYFKTKTFVYSKSDLSDILGNHELTQDEKYMLCNDLQAKRDLRLICCYSKFFYIDSFP